MAQKESEAGTGVTDEIIAAEVQAHWSARLMRPMRRLYEWVLHWAETRYAGVALGILSFSEAVFFPVPPDPLLIALCLGRPKRSFWYSLSCVFWNVVGGMTALYLGLWVGKERVLTAMTYLHLGAEADKALTLFQEHGFWAIAIAALTPIPFKIFAWVAGFAGCDPLTFLLAQTIFRKIRFFALGGLVYWWGAAAKRFIDKYFNWAFILAMAFVIVIVLAIRYCAGLVGD